MSNNFDLQNIHRNAEFTFIKPRRQYFSLPNSIIYYVTTKPSNRNGYLKLQQTCKFFHANKKFIIVNEIDCYKNDLYDRKKSRKYLDFKKNKYWGKFLFITANINFQSILENLYCVNLENLFIQCQKLTENEFNFLLINQKIKWAEFWNVEIRDSQKLPYSFDKVFSKLRLVEKLVYRSHIETFTSEMMKKIISVKRSCKLSTLYLYIPAILEEINPKLFCDFIFKFATPIAPRFIIPFARNIQQEYINKVREAVKESTSNLVSFNHKQCSPVSFVVW